VLIDIGREWCRRLVRGESCPVAHAAERRARRILARDFSFHSFFFSRVILSSRAARPSRNIMCCSIGARGRTMLVQSAARRGMPKKNCRRGKFSTRFSTEIVNAASRATGGWP